LTQQEGKQFAAGASFAAVLWGQGQELSGWQRDVFAAQAAAIAATLACGAELDGVLKVVFTGHLHLLVSFICSVAM
jgi:hypothetical protein